MKVMRRYNDLTIWFAAFLLVFSAGCSDNDKAGVTQTVTPPTVISVTPLSAATACSNTLVTATFSKAMNPATINGATFTLTGPGTTAVGGAVTYDAPSDTATFTSTVTLALGTAYTVTITTGATDMYGNTLAGNFVWSFTTKANPCLVPAPPTAVTPPNGSSGVCPDTVVIATFPQAMDPTTLNATTFTVSPGVTGTITPDVTNTVFTFTPSSALAAVSISIQPRLPHPAHGFIGRCAACSNYVLSISFAAATCATAPPQPTVISVTPTVVRRLSVPTQSSPEH